MRISPTPEITVKELLDQYPQLLEIFVDLKLKCFGCPLESFHTLAEVALQNMIDLDQLLERIFDMIKKDTDPENNLIQKK